MLSQIDYSDGMSIIIPFLNESEGIETCCSTLDAIAEKLQFELELIFVDDGSSDDSICKIEKYHFVNIRKVKLVKLSKNFGSHAAIRAGVKHATANICTWMGSDLQEPDDFLEIGYNKICEGNDAVYFEKNSINVSKINRAFSLMYSALMRRYAVSSYASGGISNIVFNKKIMDYLRRNEESNSSIMLQIMNSGFKYTTVSAEYKQRMVGSSKWTLGKKIKLLIDSFVSFSFFPIRMVSVIGILMLLSGVIFGICIIVNKVINPNVPAGYTTLVSVVAMGFGITNISLGILAEYLWRAYDAARNRPVYIVDEVFDLSDSQGE